MSVVTEKAKRRYYLKGIPVYAEKVSRGGTVVSCWLTPKSASRLAEGLLAAANRSENAGDLLDLTIYDAEGGMNQVTVTRKPGRKAKAVGAV